MTIILSHPMTSQEMRVLQEFRRTGASAMALSAIAAIRHPSGGGEAPARGLVNKGYLEQGEGTTFSLTEKARSFLAIDYAPSVEGGATTEEIEAG